MPFVVGLRRKEQSITKGLKTFAQKTIYYKQICSLGNNGYLTLSVKIVLFIGLQDST